MNKPSILLKKHARSLTKKLYDVTVENLLGYNKKFFIGHIRNITNSNRLDLVAQLAEHWTSIPCKGRGFDSHRGQASVSFSLPCVDAHSEQHHKHHIHQPWSQGHPGNEVVYSPEYITQTHTHTHLSLLSVNCQVVIFEDKL